MGFSPRYPEVVGRENLNRNGLPYSIPVLCAPGVIILPINLISATFLNPLKSCLNYM